MKLALFADLNCMRLSAQMLGDALKKCGKFELVSSKFYNFDKRRNKDFAEFIKKHGSETAPLAGSRKKVKLDMRLALDAMKTACTTETEGFLLISGETDLPALISALHGMGKKVILACLGETETASLADKIILLDRPLPLSPTLQVDRPFPPSAKALTVDNFVDGGGEIITDKLVAAIQKSNLAAADKLMQEENLNQIKNAIKGFFHKRPNQENDRNLFP